MGGSHQYSCFPSPVVVLEVAKHLLLEMLEEIGKSDRVNNIIEKLPPPSYSVKIDVQIFHVLHVHLTEIMPWVQPVTRNLFINIRHHQNYQIKGPFSS